MRLRVQNTPTTIYGLLGLGKPSSLSAHQLHIIQIVQLGSGAVAQVDHFYFSTNVDATEDG